MERSEPKDFITCRICGREFQKLSPPHLKKCGNIKIADYRKRFQDAPLASDASKAKVREAVKPENVAESALAKEADEAKKIPCEVCGKLLHRISPPHLKTHDMTMADYAVQFPDAPTGSMKYRQRLSESLQGREMPWTGQTKETSDMVRRSAEKRSKVMKRVIAEKRHAHIQRQREDEQYNEEIRRKQSETVKQQYKDGRVAWNKGVTIEDDPRITRSRLGHKNTAEHNRKVSEYRTGKTYEEIYSDPEAAREMRRDETIHRLATEDGFCKSDTAPERAMKVILEKAGIEYVHQHPVANKRGKIFAVVDFFLPDLNTALQVDGDYWHGNPEMYPDPSPSQLKTQKSDRRMDKSLRAAGYKVVRFWEKDIHAHPEQVAHQIKAELKKLLTGDAASA